MNAQLYRALVEARLCVDCRALIEAGSVHTRCDQCNEAHNLQSSLRYGASTNACSECHEVGHNRRRCPLLRAA